MAEKAVFTLLLTWANDDGVCWPTKDQLRKASGVSEKTTRQHIEELERKGILGRCHWRDKQGRERIMYTLASLSL